MWRHGWRDVTTMATPSDQDYREWSFNLIITFIMTNKPAQSKKKYKEQIANDPTQPYVYEVIGESFAGFYVFCRISIRALVSY